MGAFLDQSPSFASFRNSVFSTFPEAFIGRAFAIPREAEQLLVGVW